MPHTWLHLVCYLVVFLEFFGEINLVVLSRKSHPLTVLWGLKHMKPVCVKRIDTLGV